MLFGDIPIAEVRDGDGCEGGVRVPRSSAYATDVAAESALKSSHLSVAQAVLA